MVSNPKKPDFWPNSVIRNEQAEAILERTRLLWTTGVPVGMSFFMGSVMLLAAAGDLRMLLRSGLFGAQRIARHLWRMCFGLFIAAGSFFLGPSNRPLRMLSAVGIGQHLSPVFFSTGLYLILTVFPLLLLIVWLVRLTEAPLGPTNPENADPTASHPCSDRCADR